MKSLFLTLILTSMTAPAFAAKLARVDTLANAALEEVHALTVKDDLITGATAFKIVKATPANGRDEQSVREQTVKQAMFLGVCSFFDESIDISVADNATEALAALNEYAGQDGNGEPELREALDKAMRTEGLEVYGGYASGNNTGGAAVGIFDLKNNQILVFGSSNCGSDD